MYKFEVILTVHRQYVEIKRQLDATDDFYCMLNMFRTILCPSSGAQEYYTDGRCLWYLVLWFSSCRYGVELKVIGLIIFSFLHIYSSVTSHRSASARTSTVVCVRTHRHQNSCLLWAANKLLVSVSKFPELAKQRTELRQVKCHCCRQHFTLSRKQHSYSHFKSPLTSDPN